MSGVAAEHVAMPLCHLCSDVVENLDHPGVPIEPGDPLDYACDACFRRLLADNVRRRAVLRCDGCGAAFGAGCSCPENRLAIGRGERRKAKLEEPPRG